jgi:hypothetical protein
MTRNSLRSRNRDHAALLISAAGCSLFSSVRGQPQTVHWKLCISDMKPAAGMVRMCFISPWQTAQGPVVGLGADFFFIANPSTNLFCGNSVARVLVPDSGEIIEKGMRESRRKSRFDASESGRRFAFLS